MNSGLTHSRTSTAAAIFKDSVLPNQKYYYLFRALTEHGLPSPPTEILEVEIIEDSDESYVNVNPVHLMPEKQYTYGKQMRRFMQIVPNRLQTDINYNLTDTNSNSADNVTPVMGVLTENLWDKKFKIRLTSKHTGKKIDINIVFKINQT